MVGNRRLLANAGINTEEMERRAEELAGQGKTPMPVAVDGPPGVVAAVPDRWHKLTSNTMLKSVSFMPPP